MADEILPPEHVDHVVEGPEARTVCGPDALKRAVDAFHAAFPDLIHAAADIVAGGDKVVARFTATGIHSRNEFAGVAPTGRRVTYTRLKMSRVSGGRSVEAWASYDALGLTRQIGAICAPGGG